MYAQLTFFDGPRRAELIEASRRARRERIEPAIAGDPELDGQLIANYVLEKPDGAEIVVTIFRTEEALRRGQRVIMSTELLPGEDPALLPGPDRIEVYRVAGGTTYAALAGAELPG